MNPKHLIIYGVFFDLDGTLMSFYGSIFITQVLNGEVVFSGELFDGFGHAEMFDIELAENSLKFKKRYFKRDDIITYEFERVGDTWIGKHYGQSGNKYNARCAMFPALPTITFHFPDMPVSETDKPNP